MEAVRHAARARRTTQAAGIDVQDTVTGFPRQVELAGACCLGVMFGMVVTAIAS